MKYCYKCGNPMEDDMLFCQKCGTKTVEQPDPNDSACPYAKGHIYSEQRYAQGVDENTGGTSNKVNKCKQPQQAQTPVHTLRKSMKIWMIVCIVFAGLYALIGAVIKEMSMAVGMGGFYAVLAAMFFVLAKSPKGNPFILGKQAGLKKSVFVLICVVVAFVVVGVSASTMDSGTTSQEDGKSTSQSSVDTQTKNDALPDKTVETPGSSSNTAVTLSDIQKWYENQMPAVGQTLTEYAQSVDGLSNLNVNSSRFFFGGDWYDCYYKFSFTCKVNGVNHIGEARAFLKYQEDTVHWFSFEIFGNDSLQSVVELYDDSYDQIIEDYYKELESLYN